MNTMRIFLSAVPILWGFLDCLALNSPCCCIAILWIAYKWLNYGVRPHDSFIEATLVNHVESSTQSGNESQVMKVNRFILNQS